MGNKISKIIDKMRNSPSSISFNEVRDVLVYLGYELSSNGGGCIWFLESLAMNI